MTIKDIREDGRPGSRLIKAWCSECNYTIRLSLKWIRIAHPICPACITRMRTDLDNEIYDPRQTTIEATR